MGIGSHLELIWGTRCTFLFPRSFQGPSRLLTVFLRTLWNSIKEIKVPFLFDGEHRVALHALQGNRASSRDKGEVKWFFYFCGGNDGYIHEYGRDVLSKLLFVQRSEYSCLFERDT